VPVGVPQPRSHVEQHGHPVTGPPHTAQQEVAVERSDGTFWIIIEPEPGGGAPGGDADGQPPLPATGGKHGDLHPPGPGIPGGDLDLETGAGQPRARELVQVQRLPRRGGDVVVE
jgi:hypothetical protein